MTASYGTQQVRKQIGNDYAKNQFQNKYNNQVMSNEFNDALNKGLISSNGGNYYKSSWGAINHDDYAKGLYDSFKNYKQDQLQSYLDKNFVGQGGSNAWVDDYWNNNADNQMVNNLISNKYNDAIDQLDRALKRGTLSQSGYDSALNDLNMQKSGANITIGNIGQGILDDYRSDLIDKVNQFGTDVDNYNLNMYDQMNTNVFENALNNLYNEQKGNFENQFNLLTHDMNPFDITQIIGDARVAQGVNNTQTDSLLTAIQDSEKKKNNKVGLGNTGLF